MLSSLHDKHDVAPAEKASNNSCFVCKNYSYECTSTQRIWNLQEVILLTKLLDFTQFGMNVDYIYF